MTVASAPVPSFASLTELNTGSPKCVFPPFPGATPPTICVPYSMACWEWNVPFVTCFVSGRGDMGRKRCGRKGRGRGRKMEGAMMGEGVVDTCFPVNPWHITFVVLLIPRFFHVEA